MKQTVQEHDFIDAFKKIRPENFSYEGLQALFGYLEEYEESCDTEIELDVIAICCDFSEMELGDVLDQYDHIDTVEELEEHTTVIYVDEPDDFENPSRETTIIYQVF